MMCARPRLYDTTNNRSWCQADIARGATPRLGTHERADIPWSKVNSGPAALRGSIRNQKTGAQATDSHVARRCVCVRVTYDRVRRLRGVADVLYGISARGIFGTRPRALLILNVIHIDVISGERRAVLTHTVPIGNRYSRSTSYYLCDACPQCCCFHRAKLLETDRSHSINSEQLT